MEGRRRPKRRMVPSCYPKKKNGIERDEKSAAVPPPHPHLSGRLIHEYKRPDRIVCNVIYIRTWVWEAAASPLGEILASADGDDDDAARCVPEIDPDHHASTKRWRQRQRS